MPSSDVKQRLAGEVALWQADGIIDDATRRLLQERYDTPGFGLLTLVKYAGVAGGVLAGAGLVGLVAAMAGSEGVGSALVAAVAGFFAWAGLELGRDPRARYVYSSQVVLALGVLGWAAAVALGCHALGLESGSTVFVVGWGVIPLALVVAYRERNAFLLLLAVLALFHWVGSWSAMAGRSTYAFQIEEPYLMLPVSLAVLGFGIWHERRPGRFHLVYQAVALIYLNLTLLLASSDWKVVWIGVFTVAALGQIALGARRKSALLMGFGVTALGLDLFTRYFESMWSRLDRGLFFVVGGALLMGFGAVFERSYRRWRARQS